MLRYYALSALLVVTTLVAVTAWRHPEFFDIRLGSTTVPAPPKPLPSESSGPRRDVPLRMSASWVLSALPECVKQTSEATGTVRYVTSQLPPSAQPLPDGARFSAGPCTISVAGDELLVTRGTDRFIVPPHVQLYRAGDTLALMRVTGGRGELRVYTTGDLLQ
jgi:hypothetical protein